MLDYGDKVWIRNMVENAEGRASLRMDLIEDWIGMTGKNECQGQEQEQEQEAERLLLATLTSDRFSPDREDKKVRIVNGYKEKELYGMVYQPCKFDMRTHTPKFAETNLIITFRYFFASTDLKERLLGFGNSFVLGNVYEVDVRTKDVETWKPALNNFHVRWGVREDEGAVDESLIAARNFVTDSKGKWV